jgi:hypothetical protein
MADGDTSGDWYMRARGRVLGPLTWERLQALRDRGQLARFHEVSRDCQNWVSAASLAELFPSSERGRTSRSSSQETFRPAGQETFLVLDEAGPATARRTVAAPVPEPGANWFFAREGVQQGPVSFFELQRMADHGEIGPETLVWRSGMADWTPGFLVPELAFSSSATIATQPAIGPARNTPASSGGPLPATSSVRTSSMAFASLMLGLLWLGGIGSLTAVVLGMVALRQIARSQGTLTGRFLAIAGMSLGIVGLIVSAMGVFWFITNEG